MDADSHLAQTTNTASLLENNQMYRDTVLARNARDAEAAQAGFGVNRADVVRAREIFAAQGWEGLRRAAAAGTVPAYFMSLMPDNQD